MLLLANLLLLEGYGELCLILAGRNKIFAPAYTSPFLLYVLLLTVHFLHTSSIECVKHVAIRTRATP